MPGLSGFVHLPPPADQSYLHKNLITIISRCTGYTQIGETWQWQTEKPALFSLRFFVKITNFIFLKNICVHRTHLLTTKKKCGNAIDPQTKVMTKTLKETGK